MSDRDRPRPVEMRLHCRTGAYVEVVKRWPLWSSIPRYLRVTESEVAESRLYAKSWLPFLRSPRCAVAVRWQERPTLFAPCRNAVNDGADLCAVHGGPTSPLTSTVNGRRTLVERERDGLRAEAEELRRELAEAQAEPRNEGSEVELEEAAG